MTSNAVCSSAASPAAAPAATPGAATATGAAAVMPHSSSIFFFSSTSSRTDIFPSSVNTLSTPLAQPSRFPPRVLPRPAPRPPRSSLRRPSLRRPRLLRLSFVCWLFDRLSLGLWLRASASGAGSSAASASSLSPPSCSIRASSRPWRSWSGAVTSPTIPYSGAAIAPSTCPRSTSAGGSFASSSTSSAPTPALEDAAAHREHVVSVRRRRAPSQRRPGRRPIEEGDRGRPVEQREQRRPRPRLGRAACQRVLDDGEPRPVPEQLFAQRRRSASSSARGSPRRSACRPPSAARSAPRRSVPFSFSALSHLLERLGPREAGRIDA